MKCLLVLLAVAVTACVAYPDGESPVFKFPPEPQPCATNEVWKECVGSSCAETTCKKRTIGPGCTYDCRYGCYCADGFYRNAEGNCVTVDQCPPEEEEPVGTSREGQGWPCGVDMKALA
ncbi:hypothetical protein V5799_031277 [Amblyomma americanum]|uniref:TIL domain-containing protein n=2 Tax=Amblyomma americanum TaxID=6943 RepID=A0AAQ4EKQ4_AMBAM